MLQLFDSFRQLSFVCCMHTVMQNSNSIFILQSSYAPLPVELRKCLSKLSKADVPTNDITGYANLEKIVKGVKASSSLCKNAEGRNS